MSEQLNHTDKRSIALIGLRGSGKSSVGRELAHLLGGKCADTDELISDSAGQTIAAIFAAEGEVGFRRRERDTVAEVVRLAPAVISVGGGAILDAGNVEKLRTVANLVWLTAPADVLWGRVSSDQETSRSRPPLTDKTGLKEMEQLLAERTASYEQAADLTVDTVDRSPKEVAERVAAIVDRPTRS